MSLVLYHFDACPYCARVRSTIEGLNLSIEMKDTMANETYHDELVSLTGKTQVPCLVIDDKPMLESSDIISYLISQHS